jgi:predicted phosphate transport protein (TIGR00153 family)
MVFARLIPKDDKYFDTFDQLASHIAEAAQALVEMLSDEGGEYARHSARIKVIEHACDELTHSISKRLNQSFITPFDREDIYMLSGALDDIVDLIDDVARAMVMYDVRESTPYARQFADVIARMAAQLNELVPMLERPGGGVTPRLVEMHSLENEGDDIYHAALGELFRAASDPLTVIKWKDIYEKLEAAIDRCENVANIIESVIIKNA